MTHDDELAGELPLSPVVLHTLLALVDRPRHGYSIAQAVEERTGGRLRMGPGTLYGALSRLRDAGWIRECEPAEPDAAHADRRRTYELTEDGRQLLEAEAVRLASDVELLRSKRVLSG